jgi:hypothetical protein
MKSLLALSFCVVAATAYADVSGCYVEARTCDVFTGPCFANADTGLTGRHAVMAWKFDSGKFGATKVDGLSVVAIVAAKDTLGLKQTVAGKAIVLVDENAGADQRKALVEFAKAQAGLLLDNIIEVRSAPISVDICECKGQSCAKVKAGEASIVTRCLDAHYDKACGNETAFYPPLAKGVTAKPAMTTVSSFSGKGFNETWSDTERRGAYVGTFVQR